MSRKRRSLGSDMAIVAQGVADLKNEFQYPDVAGRRISTARPTGGGRGGAPTVVVAASNATDISKSKADFVCSGGVGNNVDHDTIMAAVDMMPTARGGRLLLTEGIYFCEFGGLAWGNQRVTVQGLGPHATQVNFFGGTGPAFDITGGQYNSLRDFAITGPGSGTEVGVYANSQALRLQNLFLQSLGGTAIHLDTSGTSVDSSWVEDCWLDDNGGIGILVDGSTRLRIIANEISAQADHCISIIGSSSEVIVAENTLDATEDVGTDGIQTDALTNSQIVHNIITVGGHGISLADSSDNIVFGNWVSPAKFSTDNTYDGIILSGDSDQNHIAGNKIIGNASSPQPRYAINISASTCDDNAVVGNNFSDPGGTDYGTARFNDAGTGTITLWSSGGPNGDNIN